MSTNHAWSNLDLDAATLVAIRFLLFTFGSSHTSVRRESGTRLDSTSQIAIRFTTYFDD